MGKMKIGHEKKILIFLVSFSVFKKILKIFNRTSSALYGWKTTINKAYQTWKVRKPKIKTKSEKARKFWQVWALGFKKFEGNGTIRLKAYDSDNL